MRRPVRSDPTPSDCPICRSPDTSRLRSDIVDFEYFVVPPRPFLMQRCRQCGSQFLNPRPTEAELPPFYPSDYHAYNENHGTVARLLVGARARARARMYGGLIPGGHGSIFDVGTGDCRHFDELRKYIDLECAGVEIQPEIAAKGRARGYDVLEGTLEEADLTGYLGRFDVVSMNHVLEHVVSPRTMLERARALLRPGGTSSDSFPPSPRGSAGCSVGPGAATTTHVISRSRRVRDWRDSSRRSASAR